MDHFWLCSLLDGEQGGFAEDNTAPLSVGDIYDTLCEQDLLRTFLYDGLLLRPDFIEKFTGDDCTSYAAYDLQGRPLVFACVAGCTGHAGLCHFCYFAEGMERRHELAREWLAMLTEGGMTSLMGITPAPYRHAVKFAESVGFKRVGVLKGACVMAWHKGRLCDGIVTINDLTTGA